MSSHNDDFGRFLFIMIFSLFLAGFLSILIAGLLL
jgi:hypothetical protein